MRANGWRWAATAALLAAAVTSIGCAARREGKDRGTGAGFATASSLYQKSQDEIARRSLRKAKSTLEKIQFAAEDRQSLEPLVRLGLADSVFWLGDDLSLIEARSKYLDFVTLYGDNSKAPYAQYQAGVCSLKQVRTPSRDQSQTKVAIDDLREVNRRYPESRYALAAQDAVGQAEANLAEHEFGVGRFYLQKKHYKAAVERLRVVQDKYPRYPAKDKLYYHLGCALVLDGSDQEGRAFLDRVVSDYPASPWTKQAKEFLAEDHEKTRAREQARAAKRKAALEKKVAKRVSKAAKKAPAAGATP